MAKHRALARILKLVSECAVARLFEEITDLLSEALYQDHQ